MQTFKRRKAPKFIYKDKQRIDNISKKKKKRGRTKQWQQKELSEENKKGCGVAASFFDID
ncbi:MAG: hypothetical protein MJZ24_01430 [Paludibacteraceae bacterium]|nr:hypothetical protein [Paludibacteraceae bacterium]